MRGSWRDRARPIITRVLQANRGEDLRTVREALRKAYPFGEREHYPYKVWLDEARRQLGLKPPHRERVNRTAHVDQFDLDLNHETDLKAGGKRCAD